MWCWCSANRNLHLWCYRFRLNTTLHYLFILKQKLAFNFPINTNIFTKIFSTPLDRTKSSNSPFVFLNQLSNLDRHFRQTGSENVIFFIARAERNKRRRLFVHPKIEPPSIRLSHPAQVKRSDLGIWLYVVLILNRVYSNFHQQPSIYSHKRTKRQNELENISRYIITISHIQHVKHLDKRSIYIDRDDIFSISILYPVIHI